MKNLSGCGSIKKMTKDNLALVLSGGENEKAVRQAVKSVGWVEMRIDQCLERRMPLIQTQRPVVHMIGTVRWKKESQNERLDITEQQRLDIYKEILGYVDYVDVEIKSPIAAEVTKEAKNRHKRVILSYHNFTKTPSLKALTKIFKEARKLQPDIIKISTIVCSKNELFTLLDFTCKYSEKFPLVVTPMGVSAIERIMPVYLGSLFTYVCLGRPTAPGQPSLDFIKKLL